MPSQRPERARGWNALATSEGLRTGGQIWLSWGPGCEGTAPLTRVEPGNRFRWVEPGPAENGEPVEVVGEFELEAGGSKVPPAADRVQACEVRA